MSRRSRRFVATGHIENLETRRLLSAASSVNIVPTLELDPSVTNSSVVGYTPAQIKAAYGINSVSLGSGLTANGAGQTIAIIDAYNDPDISSDLATFDSKFGLGAASLKVVNETGRSSLPSTNTSWDLEISLDVEWAHAIAPAANILLVEANSSSLGDLLNAVNYARNAAGVSAISMSWGSTEFSGETSYDSYFTTPSGHQGITFIASSGDAGGSSGPLWPAISDNVLSVGGTTLNLTSTGTYLSETAWSGSTGGVSRYEPEASYQDNAQGTGREASPDVSYDANPATGLAVYDSEPYSGQSGWFEVGGTSAGAPQWAALVAIADQGRVADKLGTLNGTSGTLPTLFSLYNSSTTYSADFHDVTSGNNGVWLATTGFDAVTGLGSPKAAGIVAALIGVSSGFSGSVSNTTTTNHSTTESTRGGTGAVEIYSPAPAVTFVPMSKSQNPVTISNMPVENLVANEEQISDFHSGWAGLAAATIHDQTGWFYLALADQYADAVAASVTPAAAVRSTDDKAMLASTSVATDSISPAHTAIVAPQVQQPVAAAAIAAPLAMPEDSSSAGRWAALITTAVAVGTYVASYHHQRRSQIAR